MVKRVDALKGCRYLAQLFEPRIIPPSITNTLTSVMVRSCDRMI